MKLFPTYSSLRLLFLLGALSTTISGCGAKSQSSRPDSVDIDQTAIRNQYRVGICWSYATVGLLESKYKMTTGKSVDLSEEALAFHRMAEELLHNAQAYQGGRMTMAQVLNPLQTRSGLQGWYVHTGSQTTRGGMELIDVYGVVPESAWSFKFTSDDDIIRLKQSILPSYQALLQQNTAITIQDIERTLVSPGGFPSIPPTSFSLDGQTITATSLARDVLKFRSTDYDDVAARSAGDAATVVAATKRALLRGYSVPLAYPADPTFIVNGVYRTTPDSPLPDRNTGHAVLITDFVNQGGHEGAMSPDELKAEFAKGYDSLAFLKFKNSWGLSARSNESGIPVSSGSAGYYYMTPSYINAIASLGFFQVVVPIDIANDPFGDEAVNPQVTTTH